MPNTANPSGGSFALADLVALVSFLVDGDQVNMDDLYKEVSPGATPKLTLMRLANLLAMVGKFSPDLGLTTLAEQSLLLDSTSGKGLVTGGQPSAAADVIQQAFTSLKHGMSLTSVAFWAIPATHSNLPVMPAFTVFRQPIAGGSSVLIGATVTDPSASVGAYDVAHAITCPITAGNGSGGTSEIVDLTQYVYYGAYNVESGGNASVSSLQLLGCRLSVSYV